MNFYERVTAFYEKQSQDAILRQEYPLAELHTFIKEETRLNNSISLDLIESLDDCANLIEDALEDRGYVAGSPVNILKRARELIKKALDIPRWFHLKKQKLYAEIGRGTFQTSADCVINNSCPKFDGMPVIIYQDIEGMIFVRPVIEFTPDRFEKI